MLYKNVASQKLAVFAYDKTTGVAKTGDSAQITCYMSKDWGSAAQVTDTNPTELDATNMPGWYVFDLTQAETNAEVLVFAPKSSTSNIILDQVQVFTTNPDKMADHVIRRSFQNACDSADGDTKTFRSLLGAIAKLVNKIAASGGTLTVYEDDDTTSLGTQAITSDSGADPITALDTS